jgi:plasmid stabilization system protein ParE
MRGIRVHPDVYAELESSRQWYEERAPGLGAEFLQEVDRAVAAIREAPTRWSLYDASQRIRRYHVHRFPYGVVYRIGKQAIQIIAVMHLSRHPGYWRVRTGRRRSPRRRPT